MTQLLSIPELQVTSVEIFNAKVNIFAKHIKNTAFCTICKKESSTLHQNHDRIVRDLSVSGKTSYIHFVKRRFYCEHCRKPFLEHLDFIDSGRNYTDRYQNYIYKLVVENNISYVMDLEQLKYDAIESIFLYEAKKKFPNNLTKVLEYWELMKSQDERVNKTSVLYSQMLKQGK